MEVDLADPILTVGEAARLAKVSVPTVRRWTRTGRLAHIKLGRAVRVLRSDIHEFVLQHRVCTATRKV